jgi:hypothetical protein
VIVEVKMNRLPIDNNNDHHYHIQNHKQIIKLRMVDKLRALRQLQQRMLTDILSNHKEVRVPSSHFNDSIESNIVYSLHPHEESTIESSTVSSLRPPVVTTRNGMSISPQHHNNNTMQVPSSLMSNSLQSLSSAIDLLEIQREQLFVAKQNLFSQITNDLLQSILEDQRMLQTADDVSSIFIAHDDISVHGGFHDFNGISYNDRSVLPDNGSPQQLVLLPNIQPLTTNNSNNTRKVSSSVSQPIDNDHIASHIFQCYDHDNHFGTAAPRHKHRKRHRIDDGEDGEEEIVHHQSGNTASSKNHGGFSSSAVITPPNRSFQAAGLVGTKLLQQGMSIIPCNANRLPTALASKKRRKEQGIPIDISVPPLCGATANVSNDSLLSANTSASDSRDSNALPSFLQNSVENRSETRTTRQPATKKVKGMRTTKNVEKKKKMEDTNFLSLGVEEDNSRLSSFLCFVRSECIEVFSASRQDMIERMKSKKVQIGQVGIRCKFCAHLQATDRAGRSSSFPTKLEGIYQCVQMMIYKHFPICKEIPVETRNKYESLGRWARKGEDGESSRSYWIDAAKLKGMVNSGDAGIRMRPDSS